MSTDNPTSRRLRRILDYASQNPQFRNKVILLGKLADDMTYPTPDKFMTFAPLMLEVAGEAGLIGDLDQAEFEELTEWFSDSANEIAYFAIQRRRRPPSPRYKTPTGHAFVSWTIKTPRDREVVCGIREALDWLNIDYFDYSENQVEDDTDRADEIVHQLERAVAASQVSVEVVSTEVGRPWVQYERSLIAQNPAIHRFLICLEWEKVRFVRMSEEQESRTTRIDMSGGRSGVMPTATMGRWMAQAADTRYYSTAQFLVQCYDFASHLRDQLAGVKGRPAIAILFDALLLRSRRDRARFLAAALQRRAGDAQALAIRTGAHCEHARLDDLLFCVPLQWRYKKHETGHWVFTPIGTDRGVTVQVMFFNVGPDGMSTTDQLMTEAQGKARERGWEVRMAATRQITQTVAAVDVIAEASNGVTHRFVNFCYNGLEYFFEIKADTPAILANTNSVWDAWLDTIHFRETASPLKTSEK